MTKTLLGLATLFSLTTTFASSNDCTSLINTDKNTFLNQLKASASQIYTTLHDCAQNNFCATYSGNADCLPTLNNYASYAAYYRSMQNATPSHSSTNVSAPATQKNTLQQTAPVSKPYPPTQEKEKTDTETDSNNNSNTKSIYDGINF